MKEQKEEKEKEKKNSILDCKIRPTAKDSNIYEIEPETSSSIRAYFHGWKRFRNGFYHIIAWIIHRWGGGRKKNRRFGVIHTYTRHQKCSSQVLFTVQFSERRHPVYNTSASPWKCFPIDVENSPTIVAISFLIFTSLVIEGSEKINEGRKGPFY